jgi:transposase
MPDHKVNEVKLLAVEYLMNNPDKTQDEVCEIFQCSRRSLMRWVEKYNRLGEVKRENREAIAYKVTDEHVKFILDTVKEDKFITLQDILALFLDKFKGISLGLTHVFRLLQDNNITLKMKRHLHEPVKRFGKEVDIKAKIKEFYDEVSKYKLEDIICLDETSISGLLKRNFCYEAKGTRCVHKTNSQEVFKKYTGIFAISTTGLVGYDVYEKGGIDTERLETFIETLIKKKKYKKKLIIMDNASSHRNDKIKELVNKNNKLLYSPPYQHECNGIENYFSVLKSKLKKLDNLSFTQIDENIKKVIKEIPKEHYYNILNNTYINKNVNNIKPDDKKKKTNKTPKKKYKPNNS